MQCFRCSYYGEGGGGGKEDEAAVRVWEGLAREACRGIPSWMLDAEE